MTSHPDAELLAGYREGLLGRRQAARIRAHLTGCPGCASVQAGLAEVTALLASAPAPPMPGHVAARLENALAAEVAARGGTDGAGERARPGRPGQRPWRRTAVLRAAAVVALIAAAGGAYGLARLAHQGSSPGSASAGRAVAPVPGTRPAASPAPATGAAAPPLLYLPSGAVPVTSSGTDYLPGRLAAQVDAVLARRPAAGTGHETFGAASTGAANAAMGGTGRLQGCVTLVTGGARPRLVDVARYLGHPATIIVLAPAGGGPWQIWVAGPGCSASNRDLLAHAVLPGSG